MGGDEVESGGVEVAGQVGPVETVLPEASVFEADVGIGSGIDLVTEQEVVLDQDIVGDAVGCHESEV